MIRCIQRENAAAVSAGVLQLEATAVPDRSGHAVKLRAQDEATANIPATGEIRQGRADERGAEDTDRGHVSASGEERGCESVGGKVTQAAARKI